MEKKKKPILVYIIITFIGLGLIPSTISAISQLANPSEGELQLGMIYHLYQLLVNVLLIVIFVYFYKLNIRAYYMYMSYLILILGGFIYLILFTNWISVYKISGIIMSSISFILSVLVLLYMSILKRKKILT